MEEKRRHNRYPASEMTFMVGFNGPAQVVDVSDSGIGVRYKGSEELPEEMVVDLLNATKSVIIDQVRCRKVRDETVGRVAVFSYISERRLGLEFLNPTAEQLSALELFKGIEN
ncbi:PilZ domain-containing protein [bacterium]|nr:PilZ domain-containing protein [bacterium]